MVVDGWWWVAAVCGGSGGGGRSLCWFSGGGPVVINRGSEFQFLGQKREGTHILSTSFLVVFFATILANSISEINVRLKEVNAGTLCM
ncbi:hypothetical protein RHGRI_038062 [Rhododendron griersonianum]|uniref:Uncharacterized protein n=1 Tax=Rhododendron griersonianum TaxID=479676 RepID=A0AAV6HU87_9ERIC|nr:hypothetical protein RHGRI_038062 [Rhododendron griersonianum]